MTTTATIAALGLALATGIAAPAAAQAQANGDTGDKAASTAAASAPAPTDDPTAAAASAGPPAPTTPGMNGPLVANQKPLLVDAGPLGGIYIGGVVSGLALAQDHRVPGDSATRGDLSNGQVFIQKTDGLVQFYVQAGGYSIPALGTAYVKAEDITRSTYGVVPQVFLKLAPSSSFNVQIGKLPTLQGSEYTFTFENLNINRGLLWNQENAVNRGVQANYTKGRLTVSASLNDGYYSGKYNWLSGLIAVAVTPRDTITFVGAGNAGRTSRTSFATPLLQNNSQVFNLIYTHTSGPFSVTPYIQYTHVPRDLVLGIDRSVSSYGGALLSRYALTKTFSVAGRAEYITTDGTRGGSGPNLLYGPGSNAFSLTLTPTYQRGIFFARADLAYVRAGKVTDGFGFGDQLDRVSQTRGMLEVGVLF